MAVGAGSIKRASKLNAEAAESSAKAVEVSAPQTKPVKEAEPVKAEATEKKTAAKRTTAAKKTTATKKATTAKKPAAKASEMKTASKSAQNAEPAVAKEFNPVCHLTEELPIHLL